MARRKSPLYSLGGWLLLFLLLLGVTFPGLGLGPTSHDVRPGYGVSELRWLSDYLPALKGTPGDTPVYVMKGKKEGGVFLLLGGTHPDEIAGIMAAILAVERGNVSQGTVFVIPHANNSASRHNNGHWGHPELQWLEITTSFGERRHFHYGDRLTQPEDQVPDPKEFVQYPSGEKFPGYEARNLNRNYPGKPNGTLTQQVCFAILQLVEKERVDVVMDMHESGISSRMAYMLVCHPRALQIGAMAAMELEQDGISIKLETARKEFHGLSYRELGDRTGVYAFLMETPNPGQEPNIDHPDIIHDPRAPLNHRVYVQLKTIFALLENYNLVSPPERAIRVSFPFPLEKLDTEELGAFLR